MPLIGGSGGGGSSPSTQTGAYGNGGGGGGGGAILIASASSIQLNGSIVARGGSSNNDYRGGGGGSGGGVRLLATVLRGTGGIDCSGGTMFAYWNGAYTDTAGSGRIRLDAEENDFAGGLTGVFSQGFQPIIFPAVGQGAQLTVTSVGAVAVSASPTGQLVTPDAVLSAQQNNPISVVVQCSNIPLNTQITVSVKPANGSVISATGLNNTGTLSSSTATISIVIPRGGGLIYATAATGN